MIPTELLAQIRRLEIRTRGLVDNVFGGEYHTAFRGQGIEFSEVRPYQFGDDIRAIDWNVSARTGETYIKIFEEEREQTLLLCVDVSPSGAFGTRNKFKVDLAAELCAVAAFSAIRNNDKVGLILFSDHVERFVPPKKGRKHVLRMIRDIYAHEPQGKGTSINAALEHILHVQKRHAVVLLLSDFFDVGFETSLRVVSRKHDTIAVQLSDPSDAELPRVGLMEVQDPESGYTTWIDTLSQKTRSAYQARGTAREQQLSALLRSAKVDRILLRTDESFVEPLIRFFRKRNAV